MPERRFLNSGMKEKRKIVFQGGCYQILKPRNDGENISWYSNGKKTTLKAINDLMNKNVFDFEVSNEIMNDLKRYKKNSGRRVKRYFAKKTLESKTF